MKSLLTTMLLLIAFFAKAQIVSIPDAGFKAALIHAGVDTNGDGEIQQTEAAAVTSLNVSYNDQVGITFTNITGIKSFINLQSLNVYNQSLSGMDVSDMHS